MNKEEFKAEMEHRKQLINNLVDSVDDGLAIEIIQNMFIFLLRDGVDNTYNKMLDKTSKSFESWIKKCNTASEKKADVNETNY